MGDTEDPNFHALSSRTRVKIDRAFDKVTRPSASSRTTTPAPRLNAEDLGGGFLLDDAEATPGGFLPDDDAQGGFLPPSPPARQHTVLPNDDTTESTVTHMPLSLVPSALQLLDLPPADEDILAVFRNAASGWAEPGGSSLRQGHESGEEFVSRKDWRSVCAVLLEGDDDDDEREETEAGTEGATAEDAMDVDDEAGQPGVFDSSDNVSSDEYVEPGPSSRSRGTKRKKTTTKANTSKTPTTGRRTRSRKKRTSGSDESDQDSASGPRPLTTRQKRDCLLAFAMFFPDIDLEREGDEERLRKKRMGVRELKSVAELLREKIKAEEV